MEKHYLVQLKPGLTRPFRRTIRKPILNAAGKIVRWDPVRNADGEPRVLVFNPGHPLRVTQEEFESLQGQGDMGTALALMVIEDGAPVVLADPLEIEAVTAPADDDVAGASSLSEEPAEPKRRSRSKRQPAAVGAESGEGHFGDDE